MRRDLSNYNTVTQVVADASDTLAPAAAQIGENIIKQSQEAKIVENMSAAQLEIGKLSNDYQIKYEGDPFNEQGIKEFRANRQGVLDKYGESISPFFKRDWQTNALDLAGKNDLQVQSWGYKQSAVNTKISLGNAMQNHLGQAALDGEDFGNSDATEIGSFLNFASAKSQLDEFGNKHLGATSTEAITKDFEQDYAKTFISGLAHSNPVKALKMMDTPSVRDMFSQNPKEFAEFRTAVENRALNVAEVGKQQEVLNVLKGENALFTTGKALSYAEIQQATHSMSEPARDYFLKVNGYSEGDGTPALKLDEKLQVKADIYDQITHLANSDNIAPENIQALQGAIYTGMRKGALSEKEGADFLTQLVTPAITQKEEQMSQFSSGQWNPFKENVGFKELDNFYQDKVEIKPAEGEDKVGNVSQALNATNKANLYDDYWNNLQVQAAKRGIQVADIPKQNDSDAIYATAQADAERKFLAKASPVLKVQPSIPITAIKKLMEHPEKAGEFDEMFGPGAANRVLGK